VPWLRAEHYAVVYQASFPQVMKANDSHYNAVRIKVERIGRIFIDGKGAFLQYTDPEKSRRQWKVRAGKPACILPLSNICD
jgi:hypothetical protein